MQQRVIRGFGGLRDFARLRPFAAVWGVVGILLILLAMAAPLVAPKDPLETDLENRISGPSLQTPFGTDHLGRDTLSRIIYGGRISLFVGIMSVLLGTTSGSLWGLASGYLGGKFDLVSQRFLDILLSFPGLILALALSMALGAGLWTVIVAIAVTRVPIAGRVVRSVALSTKGLEYVEAARAIGASELRIMAFHVGPQCIAPFLVLISIHLGVAILTEAALGYLGVGIAPPTATWGIMLAESAISLVPDWWLVFFPGLFITIAVLAFNLFGDGVRDALDPRLRGTS